MASFYSAKFMRDTFLGDGDEACTEWVKANTDTETCADGDCGALNDCLKFAAHCLNTVGWK